MDLTFFKASHRRPSSHTTIFKCVVFFQEFYFDNFHLWPPINVKLSVNLACMIQTRRLALPFLFKLFSENKREIDTIMRTIFAVVAVASLSAVANAVSCGTGTHLDLDSDTCVITTVANQRVSLQYCSRHRNSPAPIFPKAVSGSLMRKMPSRQVVPNTCKDNRCERRDLGS